MKYYIASNLKSAEEVRALNKELTARGHVCTYDWTQHGSVRETSPERIVQVAQAELKGVQEAAIVIVLWTSHRPGRGTHVELGAALGLNKLVVFICDDEEILGVGPKTSAFYHLPQIQHFKSVTDFLNQ